MISYIFILLMSLTMVSPIYAEEAKEEEPITSEPDFENNPIWSGGKGTTLLGEPVSVPSGVAYGNCLYFAQARFYELYVFLSQGWEYDADLQPQKLQIKG